MPGIALGPTCSWFNYSVATDILDHPHPCSRLRYPQCPQLHTPIDTSKKLNLVLILQLILGHCDHGINDQAGASGLNS